MLITCTVKRSKVKVTRSLYRITSKCTRYHEILIDERNLEIAERAAYRAGHWGRTSFSMHSNLHRCRELSSHIQSCNCLRRSLFSCICVTVSTLDFYSILHHLSVVRDVYGDNILIFKERHYFHRV